MKDLSPQTIRNELNFLETYGLLEKTHISSGRIPSDKGYRFSIKDHVAGNSLVQAEKLTLENFKMVFDTIYSNNYK